MGAGGNMQMFKEGEESGRFSEKNARAGRGHGGHLRKKLLRVFTREG
jgi:hypothetical protein